MDILVLGGCGAMGSAATADLVATGTADRIVVADVDLGKAAGFCRQLGDPRVSAEKVDVSDAPALRALFERFDFVLNCTSNKFGVPVVEAAIAARRSMLDLGGLASTPRQLALDARAREAGITVLLGCGATPGVSNIMARRAAQQMEVLEEVHIAFASFRSIALAPGVLHTVLTELSPATKRFYYQDGDFVEMPPFAGARTVAFPPPVGPLETYYMPHSETFTLPRYFGAGLRTVTVRGSWRPNVMDALRVFNRYKLSEEAGDFLREHLLRHVPPADDEEYAFYVQVECLGRRGDLRVRVTHDLTHPAAWRHECTGKVTGIPASIGAQMLLAGQGARTGVMGCEECFEPGPFFAELAKRGIEVHERVVAERTYGGSGHATSAPATDDRRM